MINFFNRYTNVLFSSQVACNEYNNHKQPLSQAIIHVNNQPDALPEHAKKVSNALMLEVEKIKLHQSDDSSSYCINLPTIFIEQGEELIKKGNSLVNIGCELKRKDVTDRITAGDEKIKEGKKLINEGERLIKEGYECHRNANSTKKTICFSKKFLGSMGALATVITLTGLWYCSNRKDSLAPTPLPFEDNPSTASSSPQHFIPSVQVIGQNVLNFTFNQEFQDISCQYLKEEIRNRRDTTSCCNACQPMTVGNKDSFLSFRRPENIYGRGSFSTVYNYDEYHVIKEYLQNITPQRTNHLKFAMNNVKGFRRMYGEDKASIILNPHSDGSATVYVKMQKIPSKSLPQLRQLTLPNDIEELRSYKISGLQNFTPRMVQALAQMFGYSGIHHADINEGNLIMTSDHFSLIDFDQANIYELGTELSTQQVRVMATAIARIINEIIRYLNSLELGEDIADIAEISLPFI